MKERTGAKGALLDEYERAIIELQKVIGQISPGQLTYIADSSTADLNCRSIQTILTHVVSSGYSYANYIRKHQDAPVGQKDKITRASIAEYNIDLTQMFVYTIETFSFFAESEVEQYENEKKMLTRWGQAYDIEQLLEHAIVHVLRHRRQIEKFMKSMFVTRPH